MTDTSATNTSAYNALDLVMLSKIDLALGRLIAEEREAEKGSDEKRKKLKQIEEKLRGREERLTLIKRNYDREESDLKFQQEKLTNRRKSLAALGNAKAQLAAEREIDSTSKLLSQREDKLIAILTDVEDQEKTLADLKSAKATTQTELDEASAASMEHKAAINIRRAEKKEEREKAVGTISGDFVRRYETVLRKYDLDPIVPIVQSTCGGCSIRLVPQVSLKVAKATAPVQCPGCSRILYLEKAAESAEFISE